VCPDCDRRGADEICPECGTRTLIEAPSDPGIDPLIGRAFENRYRLDALIGRGGMGAVYKATQITMNKVVAVKVLKPELAASTEAAKRFHREARAASALSHPHTIRVIDFGQTPERELYLAMEFLDGRPLAEVMSAEGRLPLDRTLKIAAEIASSLVEAHERGLVHRDLKPENVILQDVANDPDFVKVLDFGIAKFLTGSSGDSAVTRTGAVIGTPQYMAPEQARASRALTTASDVYSLGVVMYEMLSGLTPFTGDSPVDVLMAHVTDPAPPLPSDLDVPDDVRALVARLLAKEPEHRPSAAEVARECEAIRERERALSFLATAGARTAAVGEPSTPTPPTGGPPDGGTESVELELPRSRGRSALFVLAGGLMLVTAAVLLAVWLTHDVPPPETAAARPVTPEPAAAAPAAPEPAAASPASPEATPPTPAPSPAPSPAPKPASTPTVETPAPAVATPKASEPAPKAAPARVKGPKPTAPATRSAVPERTPAVW